VNRPGGPPKRGALFIVITDYPGGAERVTFNLAGELASRPGWQVEVMIVCSQLPGSFSKQVLPPTVRVRYGAFRNWFAAFPLLPFCLLFRRYDLVFTTHVHTNALLSLMRRMGLVRLQRLVARESTSAFDRFTGLKARRFAWLYRAYGGEDLLIAQTGYMAEHVRPWLPRRSAARVRVLPNPVNSAAIAQAASEPLDDALERRLRGRRNVLVCGRLIAVKRPAAALEAFRLAAAAARDAQLVFMGDGPLVADLRRQVAEAGLNDQVLFLGNRPNPYPVMAMCPYGLVTSEKEGFPNVIVEMMACAARKVITTPCSGDLDTLDGVTVTRTHDIEEIARALAAALDSGEDCSGVYRGVVRSRSVASYLDRVLGA
jgi:glycosyltransferase involved in cell wall biosynthesis